MVLEERFWKEYRGRFGEPGLFMPDLGRYKITVHLESDGIIEDFGIHGYGWTYNWHMPTSGYSRVKTILSLLKQKYSIDGSIPRETW